MSNKLELEFVKRLEQPMDRWYIISNDQRSFPLYGDRLIEGSQLGGEFAYISRVPQLRRQRHTIIPERVPTQRFRRRGDRVRSFVDLLHLHHRLASGRRRPC